jgi:DNA-binding response OmpR family regulator
VCGPEEIADILTNAGDFAMSEKGLLNGKKVLIVDDEPDVLETLEELLRMCHVVGASKFDDARRLLEAETFDLVILDIMGVDGYGLLELARRRDIPAVMLTAHAFTPDNLARSIKEGASSYLPKEEMPRIAEFLEDILRARREGTSPWEPWDRKLTSSYFEKRFGAAWKAADKQFLEDFRASLRQRKTDKKQSA